MSGYCYAVIFDNGRCKIGKTSIPYERLGRHKKTAAPHGVEVLRYMITDMTNMESAMEQKLLAKFRNHMEPETTVKETFRYKNVRDVRSIFTHEMNKHGIRVYTGDGFSRDDNGRFCLTTAVGGICNEDVMVADDLATAIIRKLESLGVGRMTTVGRLRNMMRGRQEGIEKFNATCSQLAASGLITVSEHKPERGRPSFKIGITKP